MTGKCQSVGAVQGDYEIMSNCAVIGELYNLCPGAYQRAKILETRSPNFGFQTDFRNNCIEFIQITYTVLCNMAQILDTT